MVRSFFVRLAVLLAPFAVVLAFPFAVMWRAGEFTSPRDVAELQRRSAQTMYGVAYGNSWRHVKTVAFEVRHPSIAALGTSRVMQFRAGFFRRPDIFYNAGGAVYEMRHFNDCLDAIGDEPAKQPRILIIGLDQNFFNEKWQYPPDLLATFQGNRFVIEANAFQRNWKLVYGDLLHRKISLPALVASAEPRQRIGLAAMMTGSGFRSDGSYFYAREVAAALHGDFPPATRLALQIAAVDRGRDQFTWGQSISPSAVASLQLFLDRCRARNIHVVAFLPPFAPSIYARMHGSPRYRYVDHLAPALAPMFAARGFTLTDCSNLAALGGSDEETIDGLHGSERGYLRVLIRLAQEDAVLRREVDLERLERLLAQAKNPFQVM